MKHVNSFHERCSQTKQIYELTLRTNAIAFVAMAPSPWNRIVISLSAMCLLIYETGTNPILLQTLS